jgi:microcompartment protein CcmK/EutM
VPDVDAAIAAALGAEHGYRHTAIIHSRNVANVTKMARALNTTLFVHNAACVASLGTGGPGYLSFSIATPTGEGVTTPLTFTRERQIAARCASSAMFLARIEECSRPPPRHDARRLPILIGRRLRATDAGPGALVLLDRLGARRGSVVLVSTDGDLARQLLGPTVPARMTVVGIVDHVAREGSGA